MSTFSTHVLNTSTGRPQSAVPVSLYLSDERLAQGVTNADGRCSLPVTLEPGVYRLVFELSDGFYPEVQISFRVTDASGHYHIPILLSAFGYTTYRGS